jgi:hypothetical protein
MRQVLVLSCLLILGACGDTTVSPGTDAANDVQADAPQDAAGDAAGDAADDVQKDTSQDDTPDTSDDISEDAGPDDTDTPYGCNEACAAIELAGCDENDADDCPSGCEEVASGPCSGDVEALFACIKALDANDAAWSCNEEGDAIPPEACAGNWESVDQCMEFYEPSDCDEACTNIMAAGCVNGPPDIDACLSGCWDGMGNECSEPLNDLLACLGPLDADDPNGAAWSCSVGGDALPPEACGVGWEPLAQCLGL